jgi:diguanylate cyclase (GGDEF)-like protein
MVNGNEQQLFLSVTRRFTSLDSAQCWINYGIPELYGQWRLRVRQGAAVPSEVDDELDHDLYCFACGQRRGYWLTDRLTGLLDRRAWDERAEEALARAGHRASTLLLLDLDCFKQVNDTYGHLAGDAVLQAAASVLRNTVRQTDVAGRYAGHGGDEFLVLLPARDRQLGVMIARRIRARIRRAIIPARSRSGSPVMISGTAVSIGAAVRDPSTARPIPLSELLRQVDIALQQAKNSGGDQVVLADLGQ